MSSLGKVIGQASKTPLALVGSFQPASTSAPTSVTGSGFTVARTGTGVFTVTFTIIQSAVDGAWCYLEDATLGSNGAQLTLEPTSYSSGTFGTLTITTYQVGGGSGSSLTFTAADLAAATNRRVHFGCQVH